MSNDEIVIEPKDAKEKGDSSIKTSEGTWKKSSKKTWYKRWAVILVVILVVASGAIAYLWKKGDLQEVVKDIAPSYDFPTYATIQDGKYKVVVHDTNKQKQYEIFSGDSLSNSNIAASVSVPAEQIAYSNSSGVFLYNLSDKSSKRILERVSSEDTYGLAGYTNLDWNSSGNKIVVGGNWWNQRSADKIINTDTNEVSELNRSADFSWIGTDGDYILGSANDMEAGRNMVIAKNGNSQLTNIFLNDEIAPNVSNPIAISSDVVYFLGMTMEKDAAGYENWSDLKIMSVKSDGSDSKEYVEDSKIFGGLVYDGVGKIYFSKTEPTENNNTDKGLGIFSMTLDGTITKVYETEEVATLVSADENHIVFETTGSRNGQEDKIKKLNFYSIKDNTNYVLGEAKAISYSGMIKSNILPSGLTEVAAAAPTAAEITAYERSLKSSGYLYGKFYDYCWDYDCNSTTYPYPALSASKKPEVIEFNDQSKKFSGGLTVPVVFVTNSAAEIPSYELNYFKNAANANSVEAISTWFNTESAKYNSAAKITFSFKDDIVRLPADDSCNTYQGTYKYYGEDCISSKVFEKYPEIKGSPVMIIPFKEQGASGVSWNTNSFSKENTDFYWSNYPYNIEANVYSSSSSSSSAAAITPASEAEFTAYANNLSSGYYSIRFVSELLVNYGAAKRLSSYKTPSGTNACFVDPANDVMCGYYLDNGAVTGYSKLSDLVIGAITSKELGWYDADADKTKEVSDKCPFNKENDCE